MDTSNTTLPRPALGQVFLLERDSGLLCRVLGLYAARGLDVLHADYAYAAQHVMKLSVRVDAAHADTADALRVLVAKVATLHGVLAAAEEPPARLAA
jgi:hypothetical protein